MTHCCSQCAFTAQFESALIMHRQLHHAATEDFTELKKNPRLIAEKSSTVPRGSFVSPPYSANKNKGTKLLGRTSSATRLLDKLRARICRSRTLFSHPEETVDIPVHDVTVTDQSIASDCTSKGLKLEGSVSRTTGITTLRETKETFSCHLCNFDADRITVLDRHLLNDHKIGLENLLKLVMAKTKDGLSEETPNTYIYGMRQSYYKPLDELIEEGEFVIETVTPKIKILKHASTNTDTQWTDIPDLKDNCRMITKELEKLIKYPIDKCDKEEFLVKMQTLNECMCKFVDSSNTLKKVLTKEFDSKHSVRENLNLDQPFFDLCLGDSRNASRVWERAHSEKMERNRSKYSGNNRHWLLYKHDGTQRNCLAPDLNVRSYLARQTIRSSYAYWVLLTYNTCCFPACERLKFTGKSRLPCGLESLKELRTRQRHAGAAVSLQTPRVTRNVHRRVFTSNLL